MKFQIASAQPDKGFQVFGAPALNPGGSVFCCYLNSVVVVLQDNAPGVGDFPFCMGLADMALRISAKGEPRMEPTSSIRYVQLEGDVPGYPNGVWVPCVYAADHPKAGEIIRDEQWWPHDKTGMSRKAITALAFMIPEVQQQQALAAAIWNQARSAASMVQVPLHTAPVDPNAVNAAALVAALGTAPIAMGTQPVALGAPQGVITAPVVAAPVMVAPAIVAGPAPVVVAPAIAPVPVAAGPYVTPAQAATGLIHNPAAPAADVLPELPPHLVTPGPEIAHTIAAQAAALLHRR